MLQHVDGDELSGDQLQTLSELVVEVFGENVVTCDEITLFAKLEQILAVIDSIVSRTQALISRKSTTLQASAEPVFQDESNSHCMIDTLFVERFNWSLYQMDCTDIESLFPFFFRLIDPSKAEAPSNPTQHTYCDQADYL